LTVKKLKGKPRKAKESQGKLRGFGQKVQILKLVERRLKSMAGFLGLSVSSRKRDCKHHSKRVNSR